MKLTGEVGTDPSSSGAHPQRRTFSQREPRIARVDGVRVVVNHQTVDRNLRPSAFI